MGTTRTTTKPAATTSPRRGDGDPITQYAAIVWKGGHAENLHKHWFDSPVDALACAVEYLKRGYQARISDGAVAHFAEIEAEGRPPAGPPALFRPANGGK